jgi:hypothetical protein
LKCDLSGARGWHKYVFEELVAEISAACAALGIVPTVRHADYIGSWAEVLREDNRAIIRAASQATKAADYILSFLPADDGPAPAATHDTGEAIEAARCRPCPPSAPRRQRRATAPSICCLSSVSVAPSIAVAPEPRLEVGSFGPKAVLHMIDQN